MSPEMTAELSYLRRVNLEAKHARVDWIIKLTEDLEKDLLEWVRHERRFFQKAPEKQGE